MDDKCLIVQSDRTMLLDVHSPSASDCRNDIIPFAELSKAPEHLHTYTISPISLWNAASAGIGIDRIKSALARWSRYDVPELVSHFIEETLGRYGCVVLLPSDDADMYMLKVENKVLFNTIASISSLRDVLLGCDQPLSFLIRKFDRGNAKLSLIKAGYPVDDRIPLVKSDPVPVNMKIQLRPYQQNALDSVMGDMGPGTGYGTVVMPCGSGKTIVGISALCRLSTRTLVLCPNVISVRQWIREILDKTDISPDMVGEYSGEKKEIKPITVCTYQVLTYRTPDTDDYPHMRIIADGKWGLVLYDEVHMLPAPVFRITSELQAVYRIGLTATLIREDGHEEDVFSLVGPKRFDIPWTELSQAGFIANAYCVEITTPLAPEIVLEYAVAQKRDKHRIASLNPRKMVVLDHLLEKHKGENIIIIGQYLDQLKQIQEKYGFPIITGSTPNSKREELYAKFKNGENKTIIVSKVANFAVDLPDASIAIQVSGTFGSRQEEAQRLGRILRPKKNPCFFYTVTSKYTVEEEFSANRRKFLVEQGYKYKMEEIQ